MPKNKTKKNGAANRIRRTANPIINRRNRNNITRNNNNGSTISYNSNDMNNNIVNNNIINNNINEGSSHAQVLKSVLRIPGQIYPRKTLRAKPINMSSLKPKTINGETYLVHKRKGNIWAPSIQTGIVHPLNKNAPYNERRAFPVQIRNYNVSKVEYKGTKEVMNYKTRFDYANKNAIDIVYIQQYVPTLINKFMNDYSLGFLANIDYAMIRSGVNQYIASMYTTHIQGNVRPYDELSKQEKNIIDFQENIFKKVREYLTTMFSLSFSSDIDFSLQNLQTLIYIYHVFALEGLYDNVISMLPLLPEVLNKIVFPNDWKRFYQMRGLLR